MKNIKPESELIHLKEKKAITKQFAGRFKEVFRQSKWRSDKEFLVKTKYDKRQFYRFQDGKGNPTLFSIIAIAKAMGVHPKEFFDVVFNDETCNV